MIFANWVIIVLAIVIDLIMIYKCYEYSYILCMFRSRDRNICINVNILI